MGIILCGKDAEVSTAAPYRGDAFAAVNAAGDAANRIGTAMNAYSAATTSGRSEEHTSELQSLMRIPYAVFCLKKNNINVRTKPDQRRNKIHITRQGKYTYTQIKTSDYSE